MRVPARFYSRPLVLNRLLLTLLASLALALAAAPGALAKTQRGPCLPGHAHSPTCFVWPAKVTFIDDGDTIDVNIPGEGHQVIRTIGLNSTELRVYSKHPSRRRGECHGVPAANELERLVRGSHWRVRLVAMPPGGRSAPRLLHGIQV